MQNNQRRVFFRKVLKGQVIDSVKYVDIESGPVILSVKAKPLSYEFSCQSSKGKRQILGTALTKGLSVEEIRPLRLL